MAEREYMASRPPQIPVPNNLKLKTADGEKQVSYLTKSNDPNENSIAKSQEELMNKVENNNEGFAMVGKKGHSFPMIEKDPVEIQKEKIMQEQGLTKPQPNRAGTAQGRNMLVNNPNNIQPMNKVAASTVGREQMFNEMAMNNGERFQQPGATTTPPAPMFPNQQGSFASYANPKRASENLEIDNPMESANEEGGLKDMLEKVKSNRREKKNTKVGKPVSPSEPAMYDGLSKTDPPKKKEPEDKRTIPMTPAQKKKYDLAVEDYKDSTASWIGGKGPEPKVPDYSSFKKAPGMHEKHTQISKANVNSAMRDDAAHASYLKRDINYDNRHGGSKKQMTADEKHISKLAGDIKYDVKKKRKYDNV